MRSTDLRPWLTAIVDRALADALTSLAQRLLRSWLLKTLSDCTSGCQDAGVRSFRWPPRPVLPEDAARLWGHVSASLDDTPRSLTGATGLV